MALSPGGGENPGFWPPRGKMGIFAKRAKMAKSQKNSICRHDRHNFHKEVNFTKIVANQKVIFVSTKILFGEDKDSRDMY